MEETTNNVEVNDTVEEDESGISPVTVIAVAATAVIGIGAVYYIAKKRQERREKFAEKIINSYIASLNTMNEELKETQPAK